MKHFRQYYFLTLLLAGFLSCPLYAQDIPVGTKGRFLCSVDTNGIASFFKVGNSKVTRLGLKAFRKKARKNIRKFRDLGRRKRQREWKSVFTGIKDCISRNDMTAACSIFEGTDDVDLAEGQLYTPRIIDGASCTRGDSPIVLVTMFDDFGDPMGSCSGTVLTQNVVLTAAHCFADNFGDLEANFARVTTGSGSVTSTQLVVHPNYLPFLDPLEENDVALFITDETINTQVMTLHNTNDLVKGETVATAGFGLTETGATAGLRAGFMFVRESTTESIESRYFPGTGANTCNGDSGGPLVVKRGSQWYLAGVVSNGDNFTCGRNNKQDISRWANVTSQSNRDFIEEYVPELF